MLLIDLSSSHDISPSYQETRVAYADLGTQPSVEYDRRSMVRLRLLLTR